MLIHMQRKPKFNIRLVPFKKKFSANIYLFKVNNRKNKKGVKYVQS